MLILGINWHENLANVARFAGSGTTAATLNWLLWELASNPPIQEQLFEETCQALASPTAVIDHKVVASLPFLKAVINETLRLHTAIIGNLTRIAVTDMVIDGQVVPKGVGGCFWISNKSVFANMFPICRLSLE